MKSLILSNDKFLIKGLMTTMTNIKYSAINNIRDYITDFSDVQKIVFIDDRVKNINLLWIRNAYRVNDIIIRINFSKKSNHINFYHHSINPNLPLKDFEHSFKKFIYQVQSNEITIENPKEHLTPRQAEVLSALLSGMNIRAICSYFSTNGKNIANYKSILVKKYRCRNFLNFYKNLIAE